MAHFTLASGESHWFAAHRTRIRWARTSRRARSSRDKAARASRIFALPHARGVPLRRALPAQARMLAPPRPGPAGSRGQLRVRGGALPARPPAARRARPQQRRGSGPSRRGSVRRRAMSVPSARRARSITSTSARRMSATDAASRGTSRRIARTSALATPSGVQSGRRRRVPTMAAEAAAPHASSRRRCPRAELWHGLEAGGSARTRSSKLLTTLESISALSVKDLNARRPHREV